MNWYLGVLKKYAVFSGRARRKEYWMFVLFNIIITGVLEILLFATNSSVIVTILLGIYGIGVIIPSLAVVVRRLHDTNKSGGFIFISLIPLVGTIILLVFLCQDSTPGENRFGPSPK